MIAKKFVLALSFVLLCIASVLLWKSLGSARLSRLDSSFAASPCPQNFYTIESPPGQTFSSDCIDDGTVIYSTDSRFQFFQPKTELVNISYIKTPNNEIKDSQLSWSVQLTQPATVYLLYRKIPGFSPPDWITSSYTRTTNDDFTNLPQFLMRKNTDGLIGLYDIYTKSAAAGSVTFSSAGDASHPAYSMYIVGLKPANTPTDSPTASPVQTPTQTPAPTPTVAPSRSPSPTVNPSPSSGTSPSGEAMPVGDLPGWKQIFTEDFKTNVPVGSFPGTAYDSKWDVYPDGWPDTAGKRGGPSRYYPSKVVSVSNGVLNKYLHVENGTPMAAALLPVIPGHTSSRQGQLYGKYTVRFRADAVPGFKTAWLLWPDSGVWPRDGEIDFPEGNLDSTISGFMHRQNGTSGGDQDVYHTGVTYTAWHTASTEWGPTQLRFILDGKVIGTSTSRIPNTKMHWVIQTESCFSGCPGTVGKGNVQIDWVTMYSKL